MPTKDETRQLALDLGYTPVVPPKLDIMFLAFITFALIHDTLKA